MTDVVRPPGPAVADLIMGRYRLETRLGTGGSAEVWRGHDERLDRRVAIKLLHAHLLRDPEARERFEREARAAATLSHPGIVTVYDVEASDSAAAIVFEMVEGETLADRLARVGRLPGGEAARIGAEVADALGHAHERGVVHRDVKPGNVLLERDGRARLTDFGIARVLDREAAAITSAGTVPGTLRYVAPEQLAGGEATPASDLYALGVLLYEMAAGRPPFEATTPVALAAAQSRPVVSPPDAPPALVRIWTSAMDPDPAKRPASAAEMARELRKASVELSRHGRMGRAEMSADDPTVAIALPEPHARAGGRATDAPREPVEAEWPLREPRRGAIPPWAPALFALLGVVLAVFLVAGLGGQGGPQGAGGGAASVTPSASATPSVTLTPTPAGPAAPVGGRGKGKGHGG